MDARGAYCATPKTGKVVPVSAVSVGSWERLFQRPFFYFSSGAFSGFLFSFFGERGERSPYHVWPIAPLGQDDPVLERNRDYPSDQPGISPAALCVRVHFDSGV